MSINLMINYKCGHCRDYGKVDVKGPLNASPAPKVTIKPWISLIKQAFSF